MQDSLSILVDNLHNLTEESYKKQNVIKINCFCLNVCQYEYINNCEKNVKLLC